MNEHSPIRRFIHPLSPSGSDPFPSTTSAVSVDVGVMEEYRVDRGSSVLQLLEESHPSTRRHFAHFAVTRRDGHRLKSFVANKLIIDEKPSGARRVDRVVDLSLMGTAMLATKPGKLAWNMAVACTGNLHMAK